LRVGLDLNGVIINNGASKTHVAKKYFGLELPVEKATLATLNADFPLERYEELQNIVYGTSEMLNAPPVSAEGISYLGRLTAKYETFCVTRIQACGIQFAQQWLRDRWLPSDIIVSVGPGGDKKRVLQHNFDAYIDDDPQQLSKLKGIVPNLILLGQPYNKDTDTAFTYIKDWAELSNYLDSLVIRPN
jgi:uncharacterized HAD superfamily protein